MPLTLPQLSVGDPMQYESLSVFPLFAPAGGEVEYQLSDEALASESLLVQEVTEGGSVPNLLVENKGDLLVLFLEGEELVGAKQNRVLNTSVLVAPHSLLKIPVSCVEQGRWRYKSKFFGSSGSHSPSKLRRALKASVSRSVRGKSGHASDQGEVWRQVEGLHAAHGVESETTAMSDAFEQHQARIAEFRERLQYLAPAVGMAVTVGPRVVSIDVFDKPATCQKVWSRLLSGFVFDALESRESGPTVEAAQVSQLLQAAGSFPWEPSPAVGEGQEYRAESVDGEHASALTFQGTVVHESLLV